MLASLRAHRGTCYFLVFVAAVSAWILRPEAALALGEDLIFADGFETGDTSMWSLTVPPVDSVSVVFCDDFETGEFGASWNPQAGTPDGLVDVVSNVAGLDASNSGVFGVALGKSVNGSVTTNILDLELDLTGANQLDLMFWIKDSGDETNIEDGVFLSDDNGANFQKIIEFDPNGWFDGVYGQLPPIDLDRIAADLGLSLNDQILLRFQQRDEGAFPGDGFFIDDVKIFDPETVHAPLPFSDGFEAGEFGSAWHWGDPSSTSFAGTVRPGGLVEVTSNVLGVDAAHLGTFGAALGRRVNGSATSNALDLHLDLAGEEQAELSFWIKDSGEETDSVDGIYLSDDGGLNFGKVYDFDANGWVNDVYGQLPPIDLARLASDNALELNDQFVVRFQQYDESAFPGDGLLIDDVQVTAPDLVYATLPFSDGFESGDLGPSWKWSDPTYPTSTTDPGTVRPGGVVEVASDILGVEVPHLGIFGVALGRRVSGSTTTNAMDLHLDLSGQSQVELRFWIKDSGDETGTHDGIYISSNGGENFRKAFDFDPNSWPNDTYQEIVIDLDALTTGLGLALTDEFVIRFQQIDEGAFPGDGILIDDVFVGAPSLL